MKFPFVVLLFFTMGVQAQTTSPKLAIDTLGKEGSSDRHLIRPSSISPELQAEKINALVKVSPEGKGTFIRLKTRPKGKKADYIKEIKNYLQNISFDKADHESRVTLEFTFDNK